MTNHMRDSTSKAWLRERRTEIRNDPDRIVFWILVAMIAIALAHGWLP